MGKALYREYRPKSLATVVGQEHITGTLKNAIKKGAISHAYLFTGPRGVGKTSVARILAHEINGIPYNEEATQIDIIEIDAASNRRIDEIRDLRDKVHIAPTSSKYKVYIIDEVHMLTREAFNALLKTLEEPPAHAVFILATTEAHKVPDTIISRTQRYSFKPIGNQDVVAHLRTIANKEKIKIADDALLLLAEHGRGSFRDSISMLDQIAGLDYETITAENIGLLLGVPNIDIIKDLTDSVQTSNVVLLFDSMQKLRESGANPSKTAQQLINYLRDNLIKKNVEYDNTTSVIVMKSLLPFTGTNSSYEAIEISLLDAMKFDGSNLDDTIINKSDAVSNKYTTKTMEKSSKKPSDDDTEMTVVSSQEIKIEIPEEKLEEIVENNSKEPFVSSWNDVLHALKAKHNTLYGVLRMAETKVEKDKITLIFQFEFHKKQLHQVKTSQLLKPLLMNTSEMVTQ
jgi:DNA polymerase III subunit gamma/tau